MTGDVCPRATKIFLAAASLPAAERRAFLDRECRSDLALRAEVESLLANDKDDSFLARRAAPTRTTEPGASASTTIGPYRVLSRLGEGGMGEVFLGERKDIGQRVALKLIKLGMDSRAILARFEAERQALARMEHSNIAKVLDAGATQEGRPYFVMEYVKGAPITRYCDDNRLSVEDRLALFKQVCSGVQHAHSKGVIHRDLTPNNVLVTVQDGKPTAKIIDFGLARATDHCLTEKTVFTEQGVVMGTPEYMSPEQAGLGSLDIDTRTDVYTLGVMLYELLTGELPFSREELRRAGYDGMCRTIREKEPDRPSTKITKTGTAKVAQLRRTESERLLKRLRGDLDWVVLKCLEKDRTRRYETPTHLSDDLQRHLDNEPVMARAPSASYRLIKLAQRYRGQFLAGAAVLVALIVGLIGTTWFALEAKTQAEVAERERLEAKRQEGIAQQQAREAESARAGEAAKAREAAVNAATAQRNAQEAKNNAAEALARRREFDQLAGVVYLERALEIEKTLHPPWPEVVPAMRRWLEGDATRLLAMQPEIATTLANLRARAFPSTAEETERDKATHQAGLRTTAVEARTYRFNDESQRFLHDTLSDLQSKLASLAARERDAVVQRLTWAERIAALTLGHPNARVTWQAAREAIANADGVVASALYKEHPIDLRPQTGLVPIGANPATLLWEFYELRSAWDGKTDPAEMSIPRHIQEGDQKGHIAVGDGTGIVFVLLPGGTFTMGAQSKDKSAPNYDAQAHDHETPHRVTLASFFLARHELTKGQWKRLSVSADPSLFRVGMVYMGNPQAITDSHPVEQVDWAMGEELLTHHGLSLPTEAQWEYGCRAGTTSPWWTGSQASGLAGACNVLDRHAQRNNPVWGQQEGDFDDGWSSHAAVGNYLSNAFGLFDVHGNVWEWCLDWEGTYLLLPRDGDGLRQVAADSSSSRVNRGGGFSHPARASRSASRGRDAPAVRSLYLGVRPARTLHLGD